MKYSVKIEYQFRIEASCREEAVQKALDQVVWSNESPSDVFINEEDPPSAPTS